MKHLSLIILILAVCGLWLLKCDSDNNDLSSIINQHKAKSAQYQKQIDSLKVELSTKKEVVRTITETKYIKVKEIQALPPQKRDSLFYAVTDSVSVPKSPEPITLDVWRLSAANGLFKELELSKLEITALEEVVTVQDSIIHTHELKDIEQDKALEASEEQTKKLKKQVRKEKTKTFIAIGVGFLVAILG